MGTSPGHYGQLIFGPSLGSGVDGQPIFGQSLGFRGAEPGYSIYFPSILTFCCSFSTFLLFMRLLSSTLALIHMRYFFCSVSSPPNIFYYGWMFQISIWRPNYIQPFSSPIKTGKEQQKWKQYNFSRLTNTPEVTT